MSLWSRRPRASISAFMVSIRAILLALAAFVSFAAPAAAQIDSLPKVHARLIAENGEVAPGGTVTVALEEDIREGWHTYWQNSGEAGAPTTIDWTLPQGWHVGAIEWPYPKRLPAGPLMQYGYDGKPWLLMPLTAPKDAKPGDVVTLKGHANWLVCSKTLCVPEDQMVSVQLAVRSQSRAALRDGAAGFPGRARTRSRAVAMACAFCAQGSDARSLSRRTEARAERGGLLSVRAGFHQRQRRADTRAGRWGHRSETDARHEDAVDARRRSGADIVRQFRAGAGDQRDRRRCAIRAIRKRRGYRPRAGDALRVSGRLDPQFDALRAADPGDESLRGRFEGRLGARAA